MNLEQEAYFKLFKAFACKNNSDWKQQQLLKNVREELGLSGQFHDEIFDKVMSDYEVQQISEAAKNMQPQQLQFGTPIQNQGVSRGAMSGGQGSIQRMVPMSTPIMSTKVSHMMQQPYQSTPALLPSRVPSSIHPSIRSAMPIQSPGGYNTNRQVAVRPPMLSQKRHGPSMMRPQTGSLVPGNTRNVQSEMAKSHPMIGHKIKRYWPYNAETGDLEGWYVGILAEFNKEKNEFCIVYDYGDPEKESQEWFNPSAANPTEFKILDEVFVPTNTVNSNLGGQVHASPRFQNQNQNSMVKQRQDPDLSMNQEQLILGDFNKKINKMDRNQLAEEELRLVSEQLQVREEIEILKYSIYVADMKDVQQIQQEQSRVLAEQEKVRVQLAELRQ